jgi:hypothetical protein
MALALSLSFATAAYAGDPFVDAEVMESASVALPGTAMASVRYALVHHKHQKDQQSFAAWLNRHAGTTISFRSADGSVHQGVLQRLKHCFGRGLLLYSDAVELSSRDVIGLALAAN